MRKPYWVLLALVVLALVQIQHYGPILPDRVASHFDGSGRANAFQDKAAFMRFYMGLVVLLAAVFGLMPKLIRRLPSSMINLPNRDYWLAPERREETLDVLDDRMAWMGVLVLALVTGLMELTFRTNLTGNPSLPPSLMVPVLVGFVALTLAWTVALLVRFRRPA